MNDLTDEQLAQTLHDAINEAEARATNRGKTRIARLLGLAHKALHAAGIECVDDGVVSPTSIGGDKAA